MNIKKKICVTLCFIFVFCFVRTVHAEVIINEIMYDVDGTDTDREWVELSNTGSSAVDIATWKLNEGNTNHSLVSFDGGSSIPANGYAVIANNPTKFKIDWPDYTGILFDSSFSLNNDPGEQLIIKDGSLVTHDSITYDTSVGAAGDGNTLNRNGSVFIVGTATPGMPNTITGTQNNTDTSNTSTNTGNGLPANTSTTTVAPVKKSEPIIPKIDTNIITKTTAFVGVPVVFDSSTTGYSHELLTRGKYYWNFGNGDSEEMIDYAKINYVYDTPGDYVVSLAYTMNPFVITPDATDRIVITVLDSSLSISTISDDGTIVISNSGTGEVDLSGWKIKSGESTFLFPKNTIILANKKLSFRDKITKFSLPITQAELISPAEVVTATYPVLKTVVSQSKNNSQTLSSPISNNSNTVEKSASSGEYIPIQANALLASESIPDESTHLVWPIVGLVVLIGLSVGVVLYVRHTKKPIESNDDFELVE